jgi:hypothetical protein
MTSAQIPKPQGQIIDKSTEDVAFANSNCIDEFSYELAKTA